MDRKTTANIEFAWRYAGVQRTLYAYILSLIPNASDADDVMQETAAALFEKAEQYDPQQPFLNWATTFAKFQALKFRKYSARHRARTVALSDAAFAALADAEKYDWATEEHRMGALQKCMEELSLEDRRLLDHRYSKERSVHQLAGDDKRSAARMYKRLGRVRELLSNCMRRTLAEVSQ